MNDDNTLNHDQQRADDLDRSWDGLLGGTVNPATAKNPAALSFIQQLHQMSDAAVLGQVHTSVRQRVFAAVGPAASSPSHHQRLPGGVLPGTGVGEPAPRPRSSTPLAWLRRAGHLTEALLAAVLVIALGGAYVSMQRPSALHQIPGLGGWVTADQSTSVPVVTRTDGGEFIGSGGKLAFGDRSGELSLRQMTLGPGAHWELAPSISLAITIHSGTLTIDRRPPAGRMIVRSPGQALIGQEPVGLHNDGTTPVVFTIALISTNGVGAGSPTGSSTFSSVEVNPVEIERLPALEAYVLFGDITFYGDEALQAPPELTDPGRDGIALVWVHDGTVQLNHQMGHTVATQADRTVTATLDGPGDENVLLHAGDSAFMTGGARFDLHNGGDGLARVTIITIANLDRVSDSHLIANSFATPGIQSSPVASASPGPPTGPPADPVDPAECTVAPRSIANIEALRATPSAGSAEQTQSPSIESEGQLPHGQPADEQTAAAIRAVEHQFVACYNADDLPRVLALVSDDIARQILTDLNDPPLSATSMATPSVPLAPGDRITLFPVSDVRILSDGRVGAMVAWGNPSDLTTVQEANFHIYKRVGDAWLLVEEIGSFIPDR